MNSEFPTDPNGSAEPFLDPMVTDTEPPIAPAILEAIQQVVRNELEKKFGPLDTAVGALAKLWGDAFVAQQAFADHVKELAENALNTGIERERRTVNKLNELSGEMATLGRLMTELHDRLVGHEQTPVNNAHPKETFRELEAAEQQRLRRGGE